MSEIKDLEAKDAADWRGLWAEYLQFYGVELDPEISDATWARILDPASSLRGRAAWVAGKMVGFALHHQHLSTWCKAQDCYLEDLFLTQSARGFGAGRALIEDLIAICKARGNARLYWHTDHDNTRARALYDRFTLTDGHLRYRLVL